jgi:hypothetical protein
MATVAKQDKADPCCSVRLIDDQSHASTAIGTKQTPQIPEI